MLDAGHYGSYNQSPVVPEYWESKRMWTLCEYLASELSAYGFEVRKTRTDINENPEVYIRGRKSEGCDMFISLHSNAAEKESVNRVDVYAAYDNLNDSHILAQSLASAVSELMGASGGYVKTRKSEKGNFDYYGVLRGARAAGCPLFYLIEHSFHTNEVSARWLIEDKNLRRLAVIEAAVIAEFYGMEPRFIKGDINMNGELDSLDVNLIKRAYFGTFELTEGQEKIADMNENGKLDSLDYILAKRRYFNP